MIIEGETFTKITVPSLPFHGYGVSFSPDGRFMAVAHDGSPCITAYKMLDEPYIKITPITSTYYYSMFLGYTLEDGQTGDIVKFMSVFRQTDNHPLVYHYLEDGTHDNPYFYKYEDLPLQLQPATRNGYAFLGWYTNPLLWGEPITEITKVGIRNLYAKWEEIEE